ncbi:hypothetical protein CPAR01_11767 [Colletotrichum paranaense]|uniref:Uncharacterized protein n=1 Tax=Colletotrichum paranaense TaxID=1914294 RepID=A0ABQ9S830_9PEZI|nr:uncharacterized protein CPAR01_11767 [Colletotrichum paranaense]KAK1529455.1 hypothetical protein CPAR01_11767 [Colletotrichum paranaense]
MHTPALPCVRTHTQPILTISLASILWLTIAGIPALIPLPISESHLTPIHPIPSYCTYLNRASRFTPAPLTDDNDTERRKKKNKLRDAPVFTDTLQASLSNRLNPSRGRLCQNPRKPCFSDPEPVGSVITEATHSVSVTFGKSIRSWRESKGNSVQIRCVYSHTPDTRDTRIHTHTNT